MPRKSKPSETSPELKLGGILKANYDAYQDAIRIAIQPLIDEMIDATLKVSLIGASRRGNKHFDFQLPNLQWHKEMLKARIPAGTSIPEAVAVIYEKLTIALCKEDVKVMLENFKNGDSFLRISW